MDTTSPSANTRSSNVLSGAFRTQNMHTGLFEVTEKYNYYGRVFLTLVFPGQEQSVSFTIAIMRDETNFEIEEGDKVEFEPAIHGTTGDIVCQQFFENENKAIIAQSIKFWKPNVVYMAGWERLNRPKTQTQFAPRPRG